MLGIEHFYPHVVCVWSWSQWSYWILLGCCKWWFSSCAKSFAPFPIGM